MKNTLCDIYQGSRVNQQVAMERLRRVIQEELTELQRYALVAYYFQDLRIHQIAENRGVNKSTISRTLRRAETKLKRYLKY